MAVIGKIRKHSGFLIAVVGIALAAFVIGDISKTKRQKTNIVGKINGEEITYTEFSVRVEQNLQYQKQQQSKQNLTQTESFYIREQTWNQFVNEILYKKEFDELGLTISKDELAELLYGKNVHYLVRQNFADPQTGEFNADRVLNFLNSGLNQLDRSARQQYFQFEQAIKMDQINKKFFNLITKGYYVPESIANKIAENDLMNANIKFLAKEFSKVEDSLLTVSKEDLMDYYNNHINDFQLDEETRSVDYVVFEVVPSVKDRADITEEFNKLAEEFIRAEDPIDFVNAVSDKRYDSTFYKESELPIQISKNINNLPIGSFFSPYLDNEVYYMAKLIDKQVRPDSVLASHVLISYRTNQRSNITRNKEKAKQLADSLWQVLLKTPSKLQEIALQFSDDPSAKTNNGDLGWFGDGEMVPEFNKAVINANVGDILLVETNFGFHIIEVNGLKNISVKYRIAFVERSIEASSQTYQNYWTMANKFAAENSDYDSFLAAASDLGINMRSFTGMTRMTNQIYDLEYPRQIVRWSFDKDTDIGSISPIFDFTGKYVIAVLTRIEEKGIQPFENVSDLVEIEVRKEKKINHILKEAKDEKEFNEVAKIWNVSPENADVNWNLSILGSYGREPKVIGKIFGIEANDIEIIAGDRGVYMVNLLDKKIPQPNTDNNRFKSMLESSFANRIYQNAIINALKEVSKIEDNRHLFY